MRVLKAFQSLQESRMNSHKNARLTQSGRVHLMQQVARFGLKAAAAFAGISVRRAYGVAAGVNAARKVCMTAPLDLLFALVRLKRTSGNASSNCEPTAACPMPKLPLAQAYPLPQWGASVYKPV